MHQPSVYCRMSGMAHPPPLTPLASIPMKLYDMRCRRLLWFISDGVYAIYNNSPFSLTSTHSCLSHDEMLYEYTILRLVGDNQMHLRGKDAVVAVVAAATIASSSFLRRKLCLVCEFGGFLMSSKVAYKNSNHCNAIDFNKRHPSLKFNHLKICSAENPQNIHNSWNLCSHKRIRIYGFVSKTMRATFEHTNTHTNKKKHRLKIHLSFIFSLLVFVFCPPIVVWFHSQSASLIPSFLPTDSRVSLSLSVSTSRARAHAHWNIVNIANECEYFAAHK